MIHSQQAMSETRTGKMSRQAANKHSQIHAEARKGSNSNAGNIIYSSLGNINEHNAQVTGVSLSTPK